MFKRLGSWQSTMRLFHNLCVDTELSCAPKHRQPLWWAIFCTPVIIVDVCSIKLFHKAFRIFWPFQFKWESGYSAFVVTPQMWLLSTSLLSLPRSRITNIKNARISLNRLTYHTILFQRKRQPSANTQFTWLTPYSIGNFTYWIVQDICSSCDWQGLRHRSKLIVRNRALFICYLLWTRNPTSD